MGFKYAPVLLAMRRSFGQPRTVIVANIHTAGTYYVVVYDSFPSTVAHYCELCIFVLQVTSA